MVILTPEDRNELAAAKRRSPNSHWIEVAVEQIVARHVAAALNEAADRIDTAGSVCINAHGDQCVGGIAYRDAAGIVRNLAANDGP